MEEQFWKEIILTQTFSGSVSLVASSVIVTFISFTGLSSPYRRLIFGLSISDICQSFAIVAGPWLSPSDIPQARWGIGNANTCRFDGFLFLVGVTAVPFYTFSLCVYYVCKLKDRMTDQRFTDRVERKMHVIIVGANLVIYLAALGMNTINPGVMGNGCFPAAMPTGCRENPEEYGECDPLISWPAKFFALWSFFAVPILTLVGIIVCLASLFWHALMREKIFGRAQAPGDGVRRNIHATRSFRSIHSSEIPSIQEVDNDAMYRLSQVYAAAESELEINHLENQNSGLLRPQSNNTNAAMTGIEGENQTNNPSPVVLSEDYNLGNLVLPHDSVQAYPSQNGSASAEIIFPPSHLHQVRHDVTLNNETDRLSRVATLSRLYKRELIVQACCYVLVFCVSTMPFLILNLMFVTGYKPSRNMVRASVSLYPMAGLFNIIVYTRPNVGSFRRKHPECSRLQAFWLVLKAGGDAPNDDNWDSTSAWRLCHCLSPSRIMEPYQGNQLIGVDNESRHVEDAAGIVLQEPPSEIQFGVNSELSSSIPTNCSVLGSKGMSNTSVSPKDNLILSEQSGSGSSHIECPGSATRMNAIPQHSERDLNCHEKANRTTTSQYTSNHLHEHE